MSTTTRPTTTGELLAMPDDGFRYELVRGELRKMVPAGQFHGEYSMNVGISLGAYAKANRLGKTYSSDTGFVLATDPDHVRVPDVAFISNARLNEIGQSDAFAQGAPDVAVEVISPTDRYTDVEEKVADWLAAGTISVIVVDPRRRTVKVHRSLADAVLLADDDVLEVGEVVPGWRLPVRDIFE